MARNIEHTRLITIKGVDFEVTFNYYPSEPEVRYYSDGSGYPGCASEVEILSITHGEDDFMEVFEDRIEEIEILAEESLQYDY